MQILLLQCPRLECLVRMVGIVNQPEILGAQKCLGKLQVFLNLPRCYLKKLCLVIQRNKNLTKFNCFIYCPFLFLKESLYLEILIKCSFFYMLLPFIGFENKLMCVCVRVCVCFGGSLCNIATINIAEKNPTRPFL